jgi:cytidine deaminase
MKGTSVIGLIGRAHQAQKNASAPSVAQPVGCALETTYGIYTGVDIAVDGDRACHAVQLAVFKAIEAGADEFVRLAIYHADMDDTRSAIAPCGICQHTIAQFCDDMPIYVGNSDTKQLFELSELIGEARRPHPADPGRHPGL